MDEKLNELLRLYTADPTDLELWFKLNKALERAGKAIWEFSRTYSNHAKVAFEVLGDELNKPFFVWRRETETVFMNWAVNCAENGEVNYFDHWFNNPARSKVEFSFDDDTNMVLASCYFMEPARVFIGSREELVKRFYGKATLKTSPPTINRAYHVFEVGGGVFWGHKNKTFEAMEMDDVFDALASMVAYHDMKAIWMGRAAEEDEIAEPVTIQVHDVTEFPIGRLVTAGRPDSEPLCLQVWAGEQAVAPVFWTFDAEHMSVRAPHSLLGGDYWVTLSDGELTCLSDSRAALRFEEGSRGIDVHDLFKEFVDG